MQQRHDTGSVTDDEAPAIDALQAFLRQHRRLFVLTGAGCSTASGIPAYRDHEGRWLGAAPIQHAAFLAHAAERRRYWLRSFFGWPRVAAARPNPAHDALATLEGQGRIRQVVTQNVDGLHQRAGSRRVLDLHGRLDRVDCVDCGHRQSRADFQHRIGLMNPHLNDLDAAPRPDGDAAVDSDLARTLEVPPCPRCNGVMKPGVVFYGANVPRPRVELARRRLAESDAMLVVGSSLRVFSGYRFVLQAASGRVPIALVNLGPTRAGTEVALHVDAHCDHVLPLVLPNVDPSGRANPGTDRSPQGPDTTSTAPGKESPALADSVS